MICSKWNYIKTFLKKIFKLITNRVQIAYLRKIVCIRLAITQILWNVVDSKKITKKVIILDESVLLAWVISLWCPGNKNCYLVKPVKNCPTLK